MLFHPIQEDCSFSESCFVLQERVLGKETSVWTTPFRTILCRTKLFVNNRKKIKGRTIREKKSEKIWNITPIALWRIYLLYIFLKRKNHKTSFLTKMNRATWSSHSVAPFCRSVPLPPPLPNPLHCYHAQLISKCFHISMTLIEIGIFALIGFFIGILLSLLDPGKARGGMITSLLLGTFAAVLAAWGTILFAPAQMQEPLTLLVIAGVASLILVGIHRVFFRKTGFIRMWR